MVVHHTTRGIEDSAVEIDKVGKRGLKRTDGEIKDLDRDDKKLIIKTNDGIESTFRLTDLAAKDGGKNILTGGREGREGYHLLQ